MVGPDALTSQTAVSWDFPKAAVANPRVTVTELESTVGGGSLPGEQLASVGLVIAGRGSEALLARLRRGMPAVVGRIADGAVLLDLRTVAPDDDSRLAAALRSALL